MAEDSFGCRSFFTLRNSEEIIWINLSQRLPETVHMQGLRGPGRKAYRWYVERHGTERNDADGRLRQPFKEMKWIKT
jgi:hypothetical protein